MRVHALAAASKPAIVMQAHMVDVVKVDWLTVTWQPEPDEHVPAMVVELLRDAGIPAIAETTPGVYGYDYGLKLLVACNDGPKVSIGRLDWGGAKHGFRARLDLTGTACARLVGWQLIQNWIDQQTLPKITRVDLAADMLNGEYTVVDAADWLKAGEFNNGGRPPKHSTPGDWLSDVPEHGRTLEIGRRTNGKMLRAYEKGLQLASGSGDQWTRFEVELRNIDREIPTDVLTRTAHYFAGAYKCLARIVIAGAVRIATHQKEGFLSIQKLREHCTSGYGRYINVLRSVLTAEQVLDAIARPGVPRRLEKATVAGFKASDSPLDYLFQGSTA